MPAEFKGCVSHQRPRQGVCACALCIPAGTDNLYLKVEWGRIVTTQSLPSPGDNPKSRDSGL